MPAAAGRVIGTGMAPSFATSVTTGPLGDAARLAAAVNLPDHQGNPPPADAPPAVSPPPAQIGTVRSAERVTLGGRTTTAGGNVAMAVMAGVFVALLLPLSRTDDRGRLATPMPVFVAAMAGGLAVCGIVAYLALRRRPETTYVGDDGVAVHRGRRDGTVKAGRLLRFADADEILTAATHEYRNGVYVRTSYAHRYKANGRTIYKLSGTYRGLNTPPRPHDPYHLARAADLAWSNHLLARYGPKLGGDEFLDFGVNRTDTVRVGRGVIEFQLGRRSERITRDEIADATLKDGKFHVAAKDARWFSRAGKYQFDYAKMANGRVFLAAVDRRMGLRFE